MRFGAAGFGGRGIAAGAGWLAESSGTPLGEKGESAPLGTGIKMGRALWVVAPGGQGLKLDGPLG